MDKKRNIFDREMGLRMNSKKCCSLTGTNFKQKSRIEMWMKWKKLIGQSGFFFLLIMFSFLVGHTSKLHQILKIQKCKQFRVTFPSFLVPVPSYPYLGHSYISQGFLYHSRDTVYVYIVVEYIFPHSWQHTTYAVLLVFSLTAQ